MNTRTTNTYILLTLLFSAPSICSAELNNIKSIGDVYEVESKSLVYQEHHLFVEDALNELMRSEYKQSDGTLVAKREVRFSAGYASQYTFTQPGLEITKEVLRTENEIVYKAVEGDKKTLKKFKPKEIGTAVVNAGMFNAVERAWPELLNGKKIDIDLVVPDRGKAFTMHLEKIKLTELVLPDQFKNRYTDATEKVALTLTISNRLLRLIVPKVELIYDKSRKRLIYYKGPSNIKKENGSSYKTIQVIYRYE